MEKELNIECGCGCSILKLALDDWDGTEILSVGHYYASFYNHQQPIWTAIKNRFRMIWCGITGKDYNFYELVFSGDEVKKVREDLKKFLE